MSSIRVNDVFEELSEENQRLLNELMFANKCLNVLIRFKTFIDFIFQKFKTDLNSNESQKYEKLFKEVEEVIKEKDFLKPDSKDNQWLSPQNLPKYKLNNLRKTESKVTIKKSKVIPIIRGKSISLRSPKQKTGKNFVEKVTQSLNRKTLSERYVCGSQSVSDSIGCGKDFRTKTALRKHLKTHGQELYERYVCGHEGCTFRSFTPQPLKDHMLKHNDVLPFECSSCGKRFLGKQNLQNHFKTTHKISDQKLICHFCNKEFKTEASFVRHKKWTHFKEKSFKCNQKDCHYKTVSKYALNYHIRGKHTTERHYKCSFEGCHKTFKTELVKRSHENTHNPNRFVRCTHEGCDRIIVSSNLRYHIRDQHSGITYSCDWPGCDFTTNTTDNLRGHSLVHSTEYKFSCDWPQCGKNFKKKLYLDRHLRIHNNDKRYACSWPGCQYRCTDDGNLNKHKRVHLKQ